MDRQAVLVFTRHAEQWRVHSPDFPSICQEGPSVEVLSRDAVELIRGEIERLKARHQPVPSLRTYGDVRIDDAWSRQEGIRWGATIVRVVQIPAAALTATVPAGGPRANFPRPFPRTVR